MGIAFSTRRRDSACSQVEAKDTDDIPYINSPAYVGTYRHAHSDFYDIADRRPIGPIRTTDTTPRDRHRVLPYRKASRSARAPLTHAVSLRTHAGPSRTYPKPSLAPLSSTAASPTRHVRFRDESPASDFSNDADDIRMSMESSSGDEWEPCSVSSIGTTYCDRTWSPVGAAVPAEMVMIEDGVDGATDLQGGQRSSIVTPEQTPAFRDDSPDYELLNPNTQGQAVWEIEEEGSHPGSHSVVTTEVSEGAGTPPVIPSIKVSARTISQASSGSTSEAGFIPPRCSKPVSSPNPTGGQDKISKPPGEPGKPNSGGYNLQEAMRLEPGHFRTVRVSVRNTCRLRFLLVQCTHALRQTEMNKLVRTHLDTGRSFTKQKEECVAAYTEEVRTVQITAGYTH